MKRMAARMAFCLIIALVVWSMGLLDDRAKLNEDIIRMHVVAHSDSPEDQNIKLQVRDAVMESMRQDLQRVTNIEEARSYIQKNLPKITEIANATLIDIGFDGQAVATLCKETFDTRYYDTFKLPAGIYESLRITIGSGEGKNWWCVAFPSLCLPASSEMFAQTAAAAGFSEPLCGALSKETDFEVRFFLLDAIGQVESYFFNG